MFIENVLESQEGGNVIKVSIRDVAAACGLSVSAVSKAMNNYPDVSPDTRALVMDTAQKLGYFPNANARALKTNRSHNLGVLFQADSPSGMTHPFFAPLLEAFKNKAEQMGYDLTFINHNIQSGMRYLEHCLYRNVDGVILVCADFESSEVHDLLNSPIPCVTIDYPYKGRCGILSDNENDMYALTRYALSMGHKKIAYLYGEKSYVTQKRLSGFLRAMNKAGITPPPEYLIASSYDNPTEGRIAFQRVMSLDDRPTCVLMSDDTTAIAAMHAAGEMGLSVPGDVSIGGYDGFLVRLMFSPTLATVCQNTLVMGQTAAEELIRLIEDPQGKQARHITVPGMLLPGESIAKI